MTKPKSSLQNAYAGSGPDRNLKLYDEWAASYDDDLRENYDYVYPARIAALFLSLGGAGPVLDVGCGTGLVAEALPEGLVVDGVDISSQMLAEARSKSVYRALHEADLTKRVALPDATYNGVVSAGTFTEGHVGPEALDELLRIAAPGAWFVLGVNEKIFDKLAFPAKFASLESAGLIDAPEFREVRVFGENADHEAANNIAFAAIFRRRG